MIRDYTNGVHETLDITITNAGSAKNSLRADGIFKNAFYDLEFYSDSGYTTPISASAYESTTPDSYYTSQEVGYTDETVYSEYRILNPTYQTGTIYARIESFGVYTNGGAVGQDYIQIPDADYAYTSSSEAFMTYLVMDSMTADRTITVTDGGGNIRNQFKVINNDSTYSLFVKDSVTATTLWEVEPARGEYFYMDGSLTHGEGLGLVFKDTSNTATVADAVITNDPVASGKRYKIQGMNSVANVTIEANILVDTIRTQNNGSLWSYGTALQMYHNNSSTLFSSGDEAGSYYIIRIWRVYD